MTVLTGIPENYRVYMYAALGMMLGGVVLFVVSLIGENAFLLGASPIAVGCGFLLTAGMGFGFIRKTKKDRNAEILVTTFIRILLIAAFALSTYFIIFAGFFGIEEHFGGTFWVVQMITIPVVVISLVVFDIILNREKEEENIK